MLVEREEPTVRDDAGVVALLPQGLALFEAEAEALACCANVVQAALKTSTLSVAEVAPHLTVELAEFIARGNGHDHSPYGSGEARNDDVVTTWNDVGRYAGQH